jgi:hypothetical protein
VEIAKGLPSLGFFFSGNHYAWVVTVCCMPIQHRFVVVAALAVLTHSRIAGPLDITSSELP